jgi:hypothetical protein
LRRLEELRHALHNLTFRRGLYYTSGLLFVCPAPDIQGLGGKVAKSIAAEDVARARTEKARDEMRAKR